MHAREAVRMLKKAGFKRHTESAFKHPETGELVHVHGAKEVTDPITLKILLVLSRKK